MALLRGLEPGQVPKIIRPKVWRGMAPEVDPQNLAEDQPYLAFNVRPDGGQHVLRGGQRRIVNLGGQITGIETHKIGAARSLFINGDGCPGISAGSGSYLGVIDQELRAGSTPSSYLNATYYSTATAPIVSATFGDQLFFGLDAELKRFSATDSLQETVLNLPSAYVSISAMMEHQGVLLIACVGAAASGVGTSAIFTFDGTTLINVLTAINVVKGFGVYNEQCCAIFGGAPNSIRVRSSAGVWSAPIAPGAGTVKITGSNCTSFQNKLWIPNSDEDLFTFDQTATLTRIPIGTTGVDAGGHIMGTDKMSGVLYFVWHDAALANVYIGKFDGTTWTPKYKDLTGQGSYVGFMGENTFGSSFIPGISRVIRQYRGSLVVAAIQPPAGVAAAYFSPRDDITGAWTRLVMTNTTSSDIKEMLVF